MRHITHYKIQRGKLVTQINESNLIRGVFLVSLKSLADERGRFMETFRKEWFPQRTWDIIQGNASYSQAGVLRGLHFHRRQVDYWFCPTGAIRVGLCDLRRGSPTYRAVQTLEIGDQNLVGVYIPAGVAHGFVALTDAILTYLVDNYYDGTDEHGVAWNDPDINLPWGVNNPRLSPRDTRNPFLRGIPPENLPK
jgi:dTDP-4-dehydrorhamnose 3,5-epimerase